MLRGKGGHGAESEGREGGTITSGHVMRGAGRGRQEAEGRDGREGGMITPPTEPFQTRRIKQKIGHVLTVCIRTAMKRAFLFLLSVRFLFTAIAP